MSSWDADVPPLFPTGQRCPHRLYHSSIQPACRELWHLPCQLADGERGSLWGQESLSRVGQLVTPSCPQSKRIAGRIVPAIITTTAAVAGLACLEVYKLVWGCQELSCYRNSNISLSACLLLRVQPPPASTYRVGPSSLGKCRWGHPGASGICCGTVSGGPGERRWPRSEGSPGHSTPEMDLGAAVGWECCQAVRNQLLPLAAPPALRHCHCPIGVLWCSGVPMGLRQPHCPMAGPTLSPTAGLGAAAAALIWLMETSCGRQRAAGTGPGRAARGSGAGGPGGGEPEREGGGGGRPRLGPSGL